MKQPTLSIITASAGTGKTYRLAVEFIRIILSYYGRDDFTVDNILVLTFTRKATAEIRERILQHLTLLGKEPEGKETDRTELVRALLPERAEPVLRMEEKNLLLSALTEIAADRKILQVMTLDSYIGSIFRNIVRPLRSIDTFEIDEQAVQKRLPYLLEHLMSPAFKDRLDGLLRRDVRPSLDDYRSFFVSLIKNRWLYYLIRAQPECADPGKLMYYQGQVLSPLAQLKLNQALDKLGTLLNELHRIQPGKTPEEMLCASLGKLIFDLPQNYAELYQSLCKLCSDPAGCQALFRLVNSQLKAGNNLYNGNKVKAKDLKESKELLQQTQQELLLDLADSLVYQLFLPEQKDILDIWSAILEEYDKLIYRYKNLTYNDVAWFTLEALFKGQEPVFNLTRPDVANEFYFFLSHRSRFILIDEFQDTSLLQFNILKPIMEEVAAGEGSREYAGLTVVGDEKQSIFGWRGGERDLLLNLPQIFPTLKDIRKEPLQVSYRSSAPLLEFINSIFSHQGIRTFLAQRGLNWDYSPCESTAELGRHPTEIEFWPQNFSRKGKDQTLDDVMRSFVRDTIYPIWKSCPDQELAVICRRTSELSQLQSYLEEEGIVSLFQPSSYLVEHAWVAPLISWLRWLAFHDWRDFLAVLRSNYLLLKAAPFKAVVDAIAASERNGGIPDFSAFPAVEHLFRLSQAKLLAPAQLMQQLIDLRDSVVPLSTGTASEPGHIPERDCLNIQALLTAAQNWELARATRERSIPAFLDWLDDNKEQEFLRQVAVEGKKPLQLMTIHKSKGLQFDTVFVFYNLSPAGSLENKGLNWFLDYASPDFQELDDYALTFLSKDILAASSFGGLVRRQENRELLEEMNNLYVAFTRAKTGLHLCLSVLGSESVSALKDKKDPAKLNFPVLLGAAIEDFFAQKELAPDISGRYWYQAPQLSESKPGQTDEEHAKIGIAALQAALPPPGKDPFAGLAANPPRESKDWKQIWLVDRHQLFGELVHLYLANVKRDRPEEHSFATRQCFAQYGALLSQEEILSTLEKLRAALPHSDIFPAGYDKVFTEFALGGPGGELRIDRLLIDTQGKRALILDYKTGREYDQAQLENYRRALLELPAIKTGGYTVHTDFIEIRL